MVHDAQLLVWLCAVHRRQGSSENDAYAFFFGLHAAGRLLPDDDDRRRDLAEGGVRAQRALETDLLALVDQALGTPDIEVTADLGGTVPARVPVIDQDRSQEIWCALSSRSVDDEFVPDLARDLLFAALEAHVSPALFEARQDWPTRVVPAWFEVVVLGVR